MRNRQVQFRAWNLNNHSFIYQDENLETQLFRLHDFFNKLMRIGDYDVTIQQFTGLYDVNKKPIYEGDIVKTLTVGMYAILGDGSPYTNGEVKWLREGWCVCQKVIGSHDLSDFAFCYCCPAELEIIGNIFENPELKQI